MESVNWGLGGESYKTAWKKLERNGKQAYYDDMPELSRFLGIVVSMYFNDHNPPHFHVEYGEYQASVAINNLALVEGELPSRILGYVVEWASLHKQELMEDWDMVQATGNYFKIKPLV